jgi:hypothetical protein
MVFSQLSHGLLDVKSALSLGGAPTGVEPFLNRSGEAVYFQHIVM